MTQLNEYMNFSLAFLRLHFPRNPRHIVHHPCGVDLNQEEPGHLKAILHFYHVNFSTKVMLGFLKKL